MLDSPLSVLVVDDTVTYRRIVSDAVNSLEFAEAKATAPKGEIALQKMRQSQFDLVLLDVEMPGMGGLETLKQIKHDYPDVDVVMVSGLTEKAASITIKAMHAGAFEFVQKPTSDSPEENARKLTGNLGSVIGTLWRRRQMSGLQTEAPEPAVSPPAPVVQPVAHVAALPSRFVVLAIGVSTGGPKALARMIPALPADFPLPIVLVQHMPAPFTKALAEDLDRKSAITVREACEGDVVKPGLALIAPGGRHMVVRNTDDSVVIGLNEGPRENSCRPAADVLFRSVASVYGRQGVLALIMTGMGSDGLKGVQTLKRKGCYCLSQSRDSCVVYGMPQAVDQAGLSDESLDLESLAPRLIELARKGALRA